MTLAPLRRASSVRDACRSKDTLIAQLNALLDAVAAAKDGEEREVALEAWEREKAEIARSLRELVGSMNEENIKVVQEITKPLEDARVGAGAGTRTPEAPAKRPARLFLHGAPPSEHRDELQGCNRQIELGTEPFPEPNMPAHANLRRSNAVRTFVQEPEACRVRGRRGSLSLLEDTKVSPVGFFRTTTHKLGKSFKALAFSI
ncbi:hypothetical protein T484DRAFT_1966822 [Baffinella frigidus]|nr:hypothetical protein T484DRAFT_1966822 [Cryptophyta sp. CCMP2293]